MSREKADTVEAIAVLIDAIQNAQNAAQSIPGNNWPLRRALLECGAAAIEAKRRAMTTDTVRAVA
jgi:hypothetical protein